MKKKKFVKDKNESAKSKNYLFPNRIIHTENPYVATETVEQNRVKWRKNQCEK